MALITSDCVPFRVERAFGQDQMNTFWNKVQHDPKVAIGQLTWEGGSGM